MDSNLQEFPIWCYLCKDKLLWNIYSRIERGDMKFAGNQIEGAKGSGWPFLDAIRFGNVIIT